MKKKTYNLVFSKKNKFSKQYKNILTGRWVLDLNQKINDSNIEIYKYHWVDKEKKLKDYLYTQKIYRRVLKNLFPILNDFHRKKFNKKNWELLLSYFLENYIFYIYDRWKMITNINKKYKLNKVEVFSFKKNNFTPQDTDEALHFLHTEDWNNWIFSEIIKNQKLDFIEKTVATNINKNKKKSNLKKLKIQKLLFPQNNKKYFLKDLMLPRYFKFILNLKLGQTAGIYSDLIIEDDKKISTARKIFSSIRSKDKFEGFIYKMLSETFPKNYLENYTKIEQNLQFLNWPKNPKIIFTSFSHYLNDPFKIYTLNKLNDGSKLFLLQHGHQYHNKFCDTYYEVRLCDKYLTWGNKVQGKNLVPLYTTTTIGKKIIKKNASGILLSIVEPSLRPNKQMDVPRELETGDIYKKDLFVFLNNLKKNILEETTIKCYKPLDIKRYPHLIDNYISRDLLAKYNKIKYIEIDKSKRGFEMSGKYELLIETINSTGFLESLSMNIPVILVTSKNFFTIHNEYKKFYNSLIKNNIIFFDSVKAAKFVNTNLNNIDKWWFDRKTQKSISYFCENMCKREINFLKALNLVKKKLTN